MQTKFNWLVLLACVLSCHACQTAKKVSPPQADKSLETITGTVRLRDGIRLPKNASLRIVVRWWDEIVTVRNRANVETWPTTFAIDVKWPIGKGSPTSSVGVSAWADVDGQPMLVSEEQQCNYHFRKPMEFVLIPVRE